MKYCKKCGMLLEDTFEHCIRCGMDVTIPENVTELYDFCLKDMEIERLEFPEMLEKTGRFICDKTVVNTALFFSTAKKKEREGILKGDWEVMFATYQIAKEGLDIPSLINLVMASPVKNDITVTQSVGRVMRAFPNKEYGYVWDFDDDMPMLHRWLCKRLSIYRRLQK